MSDDTSRSVVAWPVPLQQSPAVNGQLTVAVDTGVIQVANRGKFAPGVSGNAKGRPKGSRNKLSELFITAMRDDFIAHGADAIAALREREPGQYLAAIRSLIPQHVIAEDGDKLPSANDAALSDSEWADALDADGNPLDNHMQQRRRDKAMHLVLDGRATSVREALAMLGADLD